MLRFDQPPPAPPARPDRSPVRQVLLSVAAIAIAIAITGAVWLAQRDARAPVPVAHLTAEQVVAQFRGHGLRVDDHVDGRRLLDGYPISPAEFRLVLDAPSGGPAYLLTFGTREELERARRFYGGPVPPGPAARHWAIHENVLLVFTKRSDARLEPYLAALASLRQGSVPADVTPTPGRH